MASVQKVKLTIQNSSNVEEIEYDYETNHMWVTYKGGRKYVYHGVPADIFHQIPTVESVGKFLNENVKTKYHYAQVS